MRIQLIHPWPIDDAMVAYEREFVPDDVEITGLKEGLKGSRSNIDRNLPALFDAITDAERQGYDAVVVACLSDPGVEAARELVGIPVLGPLNAGLHVAQIVGHRTLMLVTDASRSGRSVMRDLAHHYGLEQRVVIRGIEGSVPEALAAFREYMATGKINPVIAETLDVCTASVKEDDIDAIVFGCGGLVWTKELIERDLDKKGYRITVINPLTVSVELARSLVNLKLSHSRLTYPG